MHDPLLGTQLGPFLLEAELGRGGMGVVYQARDLALQRVVAVKLLAPSLLDDATARTRFQREIANTIAIEHPHVVPVYTAGVEDGHFFIAMRYVQGQDLWQILQDGGPLGWRRVLRLVGQIASALHAVHSRGIVHRDIKPQNVLVWNPGQPDEHTFLTDFGIAKALDEAQPLTRIGALGTPGYIAPEVRDGGPATPACDQYALAVLTFELLTGRPPFDSDDEIQDMPLPLGAYVQGIPTIVGESIQRALSHDPNQRFPDVRAFAFSNADTRDSYERSRAITATVESVRNSEQLIIDLEAHHGLTVEAIAEIADLHKTEVVRLRRQAARRALIGE